MRRWFSSLFLMLALLVLGQAEPATAHLFWLLPDKDQVAPGETVTVEVGFGHQFPAERDLKPGQLHWLRVTDTQGREVPIRQLAHDRYEFTPPAPGYYRIQAELQPGFVSRTPTGMKLGTKKEVPEAEYSFHFIFQAQAVIRAGEAPAATFPAVVSGLELQPQQPPVGLTTGASLPLRLGFNGQPLPNAKIEVVGTGEKNAHQLARPPLVTNAQGEAVFPVPAPGPWLLAAGHKLPYPDRQVADEIFYRQFLFLRAR